MAFRATIYVPTSIPASGSSRSRGQPHDAHLANARVRKRTKRNSLSPDGISILFARCIMTAEIPLTRGMVALVDERDVEDLSRFQWRVHACSRRPYASTGQHPSLLLMHRYLLGARKGQHVDHANGNTLDNRRGNLRLCDNTQNQGNRRVIGAKSGFKGVSETYNGRWQAQIRARGKVHYLGVFESVQKAAEAYDLAARFLFQEFAATNEELLSPQFVLGPRLPETERQLVQRSHPVIVKLPVYPIFATSSVAGRLGRILSGS